MKMNMKSESSDCILEISFQIHIHLLMNSYLSSRQSLTILHYKLQGLNNGFFFFMGYFLHDQQNYALKKTRKNFNNKFFLYVQERKEKRQNKSQMHLVKKMCP